MSYSLSTALVSRLIFGGTYVSAWNGRLACYFYACVVLGRSCELLLVFQSAHSLLLLRSAVQ